MRLGVQSIANKQNLKFQNGISKKSERLLIKIYFSIAVILFILILLQFFVKKCNF